MKFLDLHQPHSELSKEINRAIKKVFKKSDFVLGQEVKLFEEEFARYCNTKYAVGVSSGTDALLLALKSLNIGIGDEVIVPAFTFIATALAVSYTGAKPVFIDVDEESYCLDAERLEKTITKRTKAVIPVHLYGQIADMHKILAVAQRYNLKVIEDAAQAHGATHIYRGLSKKSGSMGDIGCFSFYPTKNLGACGDAGAVVTSCKKIYSQLLILRDCGRVSRYEHAVMGYNARLDTIQAAILRVKLRRLDSWNQIRRKKAALYNKLLAEVRGIILPTQKQDVGHVYHLYVIRTRHREKLCRLLSKHKIPFFIHYPIPLHLQKAYRNLGYKQGDFPVAEKLAREIISLPLHPYLSDRDIETVAEVIKSA